MYLNSLMNHLKDNVVEYLLFDFDYSTLTGTLLL